MLLSSCWPARAKAPPPPPTPAVQLPATGTPTSRRIDPPPEIIVPDIPPPAPPELPRLPKEQTEPPNQPDRTPAPPRRPAPSSPAAVGRPTPTEPAPPLEVPQLGPMLTVGQQRAYDAAINDLIARSEQNIGRARARNLSSREKDMVARAEAFLAQARQVRRQDPAAAKSLAERAELLSREAAAQ